MPTPLEIVANTCLIAGLASPLYAADPTIDRLLASQCAQCHGTNGNAVGDIDSLAGESFVELYDELMEMLFEHSAEDIMEHQAQGYTEEQLRRIANYYSSLPEANDEDEDHE